jgi:hypothetical protein
MNILNATGKLTKASENSNFSWKMQICYQKVDVLSSQIAPLIKKKVCASNTCQYLKLTRNTCLSDLLAIANQQFVIGVESEME